VRRNVPWLGRLWGDGLIRSNSLAVSSEALDWSRTDPDGLYRAARYLAAKRPLEENRNAQRLMHRLTDERNPKGLRHYYAAELLHARPLALVEAVQILNAHRGEVARVLLRPGYTEPSTIGGYLDRDLPNSLIDGN
jgi:hypothetical protein